jgi:hypothetical protein
VSCSESRKVVWGRLGPRFSSQPTDDGKSRGMNLCLLVVRRNLKRGAYLKALKCRKYDEMVSGCLSGLVSGSVCRTAH